MFTFVKLFPILFSISSLCQASYSYSLEGNLTHPIKLSSLEEYISKMDENDGWKQEFDSLPPPQTKLKPWSYAMQKENIPKLRYPPPKDDLMPYDDTRVVLTKIPGDHFSDFVNANWIDSPIEMKRYIATQCPLRSTTADFYRMIWENNVHQVVMLASPQDIDKDKCVRYFPPGRLMYGDIELTFQRKTEFKDVTLRVYTLKRGVLTRVLIHYHFLSWPDMGVPTDPRELLNLIQLYRNSDAYTRAWPLVVHCSAGVGRTGTFLLTDSIFDEATQGTVDFLKHLALIRQQRVSLIEKPEQYALVHRVILEAYKDGMFDHSKKQLPFNPQELLNNSNSLGFSFLTLIASVVICLNICI